MFEFLVFWNPGQEIVFMSLANRIYHKSQTCFDESYISYILPLIISDVSTGLVK